MSAVLEIHCKPLSPETGFHGALDPTQSTIGWLFMHQIQVSLVQTSHDWSNKSQVWSDHNSPRKLSRSETTGFTKDSQGVKLFLFPGYTWHWYCYLTCWTCQTCCWWACTTGAGTAGRNTDFLEAGTALSHTLSTRSRGALDRQAASGSTLDVCNHGYWMVRQLVDLKDNHD